MIDEKILFEELNRYGILNKNKEYYTDRKAYTEWLVAAYEKIRTSDELKKAVLKNRLDYYYFIVNFMKK